MSAHALGGRALLAAVDEHDGLLAAQVPVSCLEARLG
jgi:hypothetical protein